jgi:hypothetical protein
VIQQVNLYQLGLRRAPVVLPAELLLRIAAGAVLALALVWAWGAFQSWLAHSRLAELELERSLLTSRMAELNERASGFGLNPALAAEVSSLASEHDAKRELLGLLSQQAPGSVAGFSAHLAGLGRQAVEGLWLRAIAIHQGGRGLVLEGSALDAERVPELLEKLKGERAFAGHEFHSFRMRSATDQPWFDFQLSSAPKEGS